MWSQFLHAIPILQMTQVLEIFCLEISGPRTLRSKQHGFSGSGDTRSQGIVQLFRNILVSALEATAEYGMYNI